MPTINYDKLEIYFRAKVFPGLEDLIWQARPGLRLLMGSTLKGGREFRLSSKELQGKAKSASLRNKQRMIKGLTVEQPITILPGSAGNWGSGKKTMTHNVNENRTKARWALSRGHKDAVLEDDKFRAAQSKGSSDETASDTLNLMANEMNDCYEQLVSEISADVFGTNTDEELGVLALHAGTGIVADDDTTYGGISRDDSTGYPVWRSNVGSFADEAELPDPTDADYILRRMNNAVFTLLTNRCLPDNMVFILGESSFEVFHEVIAGITSVASVQPITGRYNIGDGSGIPGFTGLTLSGVPVMYEPDLSAYDIDLYDMSTTFMVGMPGALFDHSKWKMSEHATTMWSRMAYFGQALLTHPRRNYHIYDSG